MVYREARSGHGRVARARRVMATPRSLGTQWLLLAAVPAFVAGVAFALRDQHPEQWLVALPAMGLALLLA